MNRHRLSLIAAAVCLGALISTAPAAAARDRTPPTTPSNLRTTATSDTSISLAWDASTDNSGNFWYCVQIDGQSCFRVNPPRTTITFTRLLPERTFTYTVVALDNAGNRSAASNAVTFTTPPDTRPPSPAPTLSLMEAFPTRVSVAWTQAVDDISQVWTTLLVNGSPYFTDDLRPPSAVVGNLSPGTTYELQVTVRDASGNVAESNVLSVTTPAVTDAEPPTAPANLRVSSSSYPPDILLLWDQSTDNVDPQSQIHYDVVIAGEPGGGVIGVGRAFFSCPAEGSAKSRCR